MAAEAAPVPTGRVQEKAARRADRRPKTPQAQRLAQAAPPEGEAPAREPVLAAPVVAAVTPLPAPVPHAAPRLPASNSPASAAPATNRAFILYTNTPGTQCGACETVKISVAPSGKVLIERGHWVGAQQDWRYRRSIAHTSPERAAAFAARLAAYRPDGDQVLGGGPICAASATTDDGVAIDWVEAGRHDRTTFTFGCAERRNSQIADTLRHAPDLLGLSQLVFPWSASQ